MSLTTFEIQDFARPVYAVKFPVLKCMDGVSQSHFILIFFNFTNPQTRSALSSHSWQRTLTDIRHQHHPESHELSEVLIQPRYTATIFQGSLKWHCWLIQSGARLPSGRLYFIIPNETIAGAQLVFAHTCSETTLSYRSWGKGARAITYETVSLSSNHSQIAFCKQNV